MARTLFLLSALTHLLFLAPRPAHGDPGRWTGTLSFALLRNSPVSPADDFYEHLSATISGLWAASDHVSLGPELGYHGVETVEGIQCGPEWGVDCTPPDNLREGAWQASALVRVHAEYVGMHPYVIAGAGAYVPGNYVVTNRQATIDHHVEPGVTAGFGVRGGLLGVEGRWHYIHDGTAEPTFSSSVESYSYGPLRILSASVCLYFP